MFVVLCSSVCMGAVGGQSGLYDVLYVSCASLYCCCGGVWVCGVCVAECDPNVFFVALSHTPTVGHIAAVASSRRNLSVKITGAVGERLAKDGFYTRVRI